MPAERLATICSRPGMLPGETFQMWTVASWQPATNHMDPSGSFATSADRSAPYKVLPPHSMT